jgi:geranyl-CoA carboxylase alpha subunit
VGVTVRGARDARFDSVLVANRGEIAVRVLRTARALGYRTVAVYSDADAGAPHVAAADVAVRIGPPPPAESYLLIEAILDAARRAGAGAVHPGYGFLAENAGFAEACLEAGLLFVGPGPEAIALMGDKAAAKRRMAAAGVPVLAGYHGADQSDRRLCTEASRIGFPLMVKAAAGGGGKGMRLVGSSDGLPDALAAARREASGAFGSDVLILERAVSRPRHVEVQVLADEYGRVVALGERDCSVQRRHQKVIEETPCPVLTAEQRAALAEAAITVAADIGYVGAGTVEFILDPDGAFAFLEMNTRLQVEHPVTELVTGVDLVAWQMRIAQGEPLTLEPTPTGHAIEARLYAEDPAAGFLPATGVLHGWRPPTGDGVRVDSGVAEGGAVTPHYDPMLAKIIAHGADREQARRRLVAALRRTVALGVATNRGFLLDVLHQPEFVVGTATTALLAEAELPPARPTGWHLAVAAAVLHRAAERMAGQRSPGLAGWTNAEALHSRMCLTGGDRATEVELRRHRDGLTVNVEDRGYRFEPGDRLVCDGVGVDCDARLVGAGRVLLRFAELDLDVSDTLLDPPVTADAVGSGVLTSVMHGSVAAVFAQVGASVRVGDRLLVLEAMKMEQPLLADVDGRLTEIVTAGTQVAAGELLARIEPAEGVDA